jgi:hypothetical protein
MKLLNTLNGSIILEVSEKLKKQLLDKFKLETQDSEEQIVKYINDFERLKQSLPTDKRDITRYDYKTLKSLIDAIEKAKTRKEDINSSVTNFIQKAKKNEIPPLEALKRAVKKFFEIQTEIKDAPKDINKYSYLKLIQFLEKNYESLLTQKLINKLKTENQTLTTEQIFLYVNEYLQNFNDIPLETPSADLMSFTQLEHLVDSLISKRGVGKETKTYLEDIDVIYNDKNGFKVYAPKGKEHCIKLAHGRGYCIGWLGGANLYYRYRLIKNRTIYYVVDESLDYEDRYYVTVVLVDPYGKTAFADKTNSAPYHGDTDLPWSEISGFVPKLKNLENLFVSRPLSQDEIEMRDKYQGIQYNLRHGLRLPNNQTPMEYFNSPKEVGLWMEIQSPELFDEDYASLTTDLKKKYIALGFDLTAKQIASSEATVLNYYANKKIEKIKQTPLQKLSDSDIALLNSPIFKKIKEDLKERFAAGLTAQDGEKLEISNLKSGDVGKFISLYGLQEIFESMGDNLVDIVINVGDSGDFIQIPKNITRFKKLRQLTLQKNAINQLPDFICDIESLQFIGLTDNPELTSLPECIGNLPNLEIISFKGSGINEIPNSLKENFYMVAPQMYQVEDGF